MATETTSRVQWIGDTTTTDLDVIGGKAASLQALASNFPVPEGFVITTGMYESFIEQAGIASELRSTLVDSNPKTDSERQEIAEQAQSLILEADVPSEISEHILEEYDSFQPKSQLVAVRSSAIAEDLPDASFAGQLATSLNVDREGLLPAIKRCWASLYTPRAIAYREEQDFPVEDVATAVIVQRMVDSEKSGVLFTSEPSTGADRCIIEAAWGLGEAVVSGTVTPDTYVLDGDGGVQDIQVAEQSLMYELDTDSGDTVTHDVDPNKRNRRVLSDDELSRLRLLGMRIEDHYGTPQDIEWAIAGGKLYVLQARDITTLPAETGAQDSTRSTTESILIEGLGSSPGIGTGPVRVITDSSDSDAVQDGDILVTEMTTPDMMTALRRASGLVTDAGGMTSHAAIVARELGVPAVLGTENATSVLDQKDCATVDGDRGVVLEGSVLETDSNNQPDATSTVDQPITATDVKVNVSLPTAAERAAKTGADGVGLMRTEHFILSLGKTPAQYIADHGEAAYRDALRDGLQEVAEAFYPQPVRVRTMDAPTDEFRELTGGRDEPSEHNPMLGYRGIRRSLNEPEIFHEELLVFHELFEMGYDNLEIMFPLVTDGGDVEAAREHLIKAGIDPSTRRWGVMIETPASALTIDLIVEFGVDFVSFGTNDLTQYILAVDRNNERVADRYDATHQSVKRVLSEVITVCNKKDVSVSICGEVASTPAMVDFLVCKGINSLSVNIDAVQEVRRRVKRTEQNLILDHARSHQ